MMLQTPPLVNLAITTGEPAGIGPEVSVVAAKLFLDLQPDASVTLLGDRDLLNSANSSGGYPERMYIQDVKLSAPVMHGNPSPQNVPYVISTLNQAVEGCLAKCFDAMITAPIQKSVINQAGIPFGGHTEYLAERCNTNRVVMMLCANLPKGLLGLKESSALRVALATTHLPLKEIASSLSQKLISEVIEIVQRDLKTKFGIANPSIRVAGLNPHAGESGYLGHEEIEIITPAIELAKKQGIQISGPYPGDTMFDAAALGKVDAFIAMYHDQGLAPFKFVTFGGGVNVTLGLPIIRTSVDHGTALDIAGNGLADPGSMLEALHLAYQMALNQKKMTS